MKGGQHLPKHIGGKKWGAMENMLGNTLGTWREHSENTLGTSEKWKKKSYFPPPPQPKLKRKKKQGALINWGYLYTQWPVVVHPKLSDEGSLSSIHHPPPQVLGGKRAGTSAHQLVAPTCQSHEQVSNFGYVLVSVWKEFAKCHLWDELLWVTLQTS